MVARSPIVENRTLPIKIHMSQLQEYIDKHPSETQSLLGRNYEQLMNLIVQSEGLPAQK